MKLLAYLYSLYFLIDVISSNDLEVEKTIKKLTKTVNEKQAIAIIKDLIYNEVKFESDVSVLRFFFDKNWANGFKLTLEFLYNVSVPKVAAIAKEFNQHEEKLIREFKDFIGLNKKKDIIRISPVFEWSQSDEEVKIRLKFAKNLETPGDKDVLNFKVNCTRSQLEVQAYKFEDEYVVHYYRRLNLYEFIRPHTCKSYKETDGTFIVHFHKNQYTLYWNFLNQPTEDHYNLHTWFEVFSKYDGKIQYTEFRETAMENLLISDLEEYVKDNSPAKRKRMRNISNAANFLNTKNNAAKNYCLSPVLSESCILPKLDQWGFWLN